MMNYTFDYTSEVRRKNLPEALIWYRRAAAQGDADFQLAPARLVAIQQRKTVLRRLW